MRFKVMTGLICAALLVGCVKEYQKGLEQVGAYNYKGTSYRVVRAPYTFNGQPGTDLLLFRNDGKPFKPGNHLASCDAAARQRDCEKAFGAQLQRMMDEANSMTGDGGGY